MSEEVVVAGVRLSHPDKVLYPEQGITKGALAAYYDAVAKRQAPEAIPFGLELPTGIRRQFVHQPRLHRMRIERNRQPRK